MKKSYILTSLLSIIVLQGCKEEQSSGFKNLQIADYVFYDAEKFPSYNANYSPPAGAPEVFELSQEFPKSTANENYPWLSIDFKEQPSKYLETVLKYC